MTKSSTKLTKQLETRLEIVRYSTRHRDANIVQRRIMFEGFELKRRDVSEDALNSLMNMLWDLETLCNLNSILTPSLAEIRNAQDSTYKSVKSVGNSSST